MKCPKCGYLGFESVERCRNCGYDFSLSPAADVLELPLRAPTTPSPAPASSPSPPSGAAATDRRQPADELVFLDTAWPSESVPQSSAIKPVSRVAAAAAPASNSESGDLPLFEAEAPEDAPLITKAPPPRPPLAVRRATPETPRLRSMPPRSATLDLGLESPARSAAPSAGAQSIEMGSEPASEALEQEAPLGARLAAVVGDLIILAAIDAVVVYFTMQICGIGLADLAILPRAPLVAFLFVQNVGYLVAFTASGQTLGKMAAGIKVVAAEPDFPLDFGRAFLRELIWIVLAAPAGLGLLTVLSRDRRGVHDRFAGTRVVRA